MGYDEGRLTPEAAHHILLEGREQLTVSGVEEVESFDENTIVMVTSKGTLVVRGEDLHIEKLSLDGGDLKVEGRWTPSPMRMTAGGGADCSPACSADDGGHRRPAGGASPGGGPGSGRRPAVRPVPRPALPGVPPPAGSGAGPAVLAGADRGAVPLVSVGLGRPSAAVWGRVPLPGRGALFPAVQPLDAVFGLSYRRFDNLFVGDPGPSVVCTKSDVQKTQKTCKKYLPFCWEMV